MIKITTKSLYAVRAIYAIARLNGDKQSVTMGKILEIEDISKKYLEQIFTKLRNGNIIIGSRGVGGGYKLSRTPDKINLKEIINIMDGPIETVDCSSADSCSNYSVCGVNWLWDGLKKCCDDYFEKITIADLINKPIKL